MRPEGSTVHGYTEQEQPWTGAAAHKEEPQWGNWAGGAAPVGTCVKQLLKDGCCGMWRAAAHAESVWEGWHPMENAGTREESDHKGVTVTKFYRQTLQAFWFNIRKKII